MVAAVDFNVLLYKLSRLDVRFDEVKLRFLVQLLLDNFCHNGQHKDGYGHWNVLFLSFDCLQVHVVLYNVFVFHQLLYRLVGI